MKIHEIIGTHIFQTKTFGFYFFISAEEVKVLLENFGAKRDNFKLKKKQFCIRRTSSQFSSGSTM